MTTTINASTSAGGGIIQTADASGILALQTAGTTAITIDGSQNVGVGTTSPTGKLTVSNGTITGVVNPNSGLGAFAFGTTTNHPIQFITNNTAQGLYQDTSGNVGIGTSSPAAKLQVNTGRVYIEGNNEQYCLRLTYNNATSGVYLGSPSANTFTIADNGGTERMRLDASGNLLVGTTSDVNSGGFKFFPNYSRTGSSAVEMGHISGSASGEGFVGFKYNGGTIGSITQNGTTGVLYNLTSDYRLKNDQQPLTGAKEFVMALQPKKWQWWDGSGEGVGFIAHEFMEVAKYSGHGEKDAVDENGNIIPQSIQPSSSEVMANLVAFIQEQQALITTLTERITALEGK